MKKPRIFQSFLKGINILELIAVNPDGMRLSDIANEMDNYPSNITLYLNTLIKAGFLIRDPLTRKYYISPATIDMFRNASEGMIHHLIPHAEESMEYLYKLYNENVLLGFRKENSIFFVRHLMSGHVMRVGIDLNPECPMHATAAGRAILAFLPEKEINSYIRTAVFEKITSKTIASEEALREALTKTQESGYAFNPGEFENEVMATAAPIMVNNYPILSLAVQFPTLRHDAKEANRASIEIMKQARIIEEAFKKGDVGGN